MSDNDESYIDKINQLTEQPSAPTDPVPAADAMTSGSQAMLTQAQNGELRFNPATGQALINTLNTQIDRLTSLQPHLAVISRQTKLGMTAGGQAMSAFNQEVAVSGAKAFMPAHNQFVQTLQTMVQAIQIAMDNYANTDTDNAQNLKPKD